MIQKSPIVKYDRGLRKYYNSIFELNKVELDLFNTVLSFICDEKKQKLEITYSDIIARSKYTSINKGECFTVKKMVKYLDSMSDKIGGMYCLVFDESSGMDIKMYLFDAFGINKKTGDLKISLAPTFSAYFFNIPASRAFTRYYLSKMLELKSKYAKILYQVFLDNHNGFTVSIDEFDKLFNIEKPESRRTVINRLRFYLKQIDATGDFVDPIKYHTNKDPYNAKKTKSITFEYCEKKRRVIEFVAKTNNIDTNNVVESSITALPPIVPPIEPVMETNDDELLRCPYDNDIIIERADKSGKKFWGHKNYKGHRGCPLKNTDTFVEMKVAIDEANQKIAEQKANDVEKKYRELALAELQEEYPDGMPTEHDPRKVSFEDIQRAQNLTLNGGFSQNDINKKVAEIKARESN